MNHPEATFLTVAVALTSFAMVYFLDPPAPRYYPLERAWRWQKSPEQPSIGWYGRSAWGLAVAVLGGGVTSLAVRCLGGSDTNGSGLSEAMVQSITWLTLMALVGLAVFFVVHYFNGHGVWRWWDFPLAQR